MCLIFESRKSPSEQPFTAYKVYYRDDAWLRSPYYPHLSNGTIFGPGEYELSESNGFQKLKVYGYDQNARRGERSYSIYADDLGDEYVKHSMDVEGFHCLLNEDDAKEYLNYVSHFGMAHYPRANGRFVVVPVQVDPADVVAFGTTPSNRLINGQVASYPTVVTRKFTLTPEAYDNACPDAPCEETTSCA